LLYSPYNVHCFAPPALYLNGAPKVLVDLEQHPAAPGAPHRLQLIAAQQGKVPFIDRH
jgi:hypothetical protein